MTYATQQDLIDRFGAGMLLGLTDRATPPTGLIDATVVAKALADTDAVVNGYIRARYIVPLAAVPPQIADIAAAIAIWKLHTFKPDEKIAEDYRDALKALREISAGVITLEVAGIISETTGGTGAQVTDRERPLTAENLKGYI